MGKLLSDRERIELKQLRKQYRRTNSEGYSRVCVILAVDMGFSYDTIHDLFGVSASTVSKYEEEYEKGGLKLLLANHYKAYKGRLTEEKLKRLDKMLEDQLYMKARDVVRLIETFFREIKRYKSELRSLMRPNFQKLSKTVHFNFLNHLPLSIKWITAANKKYGLQKDFNQD